jgi:hypothetical protein
MDGPFRFCGVSHHTRPDTLAYNEMPSTRGFVHFNESRDSSLYPQAAHGLRSSGKSSTEHTASVIDSFQNSMTDADSVAAYALTEYPRGLGDLTPNFPAPPPSRELESLPIRGTIPRSQGTNLCPVCTAYFVNNHRVRSAVSERPNS